MVQVLLLLPLALQPTVGFGLSNNVLPFFPICHQLSPSSHSQHLKISFYFLFPALPGSSPSSRPFQFLSEYLFGRLILLPFSLSDLTSLSFACSASYKSEYSFLMINKYYILSKYFKDNTNFKTVI